MTRNLKWIVGVTLGLAGLWGPVVAHAYIPPSPFIVKKVATKRAGFKGFRFKFQVTGADATTGGKFKELGAFDAATRTLRSRAVDEAGKTLYTVERHFPSTATPADELLFEARPETLSAALKEAGIPIRPEVTEGQTEVIPDLSKMARWKGSVAWVIGESSQFWVEKDSFLPLRLILSQNGADIRLENYRHFKEMPFPRLVSLFETGKSSEVPVLKAELIDLVVNPDLSEFKQPPAGPSGFTDAGNSAESATRDLIRRYYQVIR